MKVVLALGLALSASVAMAEPANVNVDIFKATGYVRTPASATDRKAADLPSAVAVWNGSAWWQVLTYCSAMHFTQEQRIDTGATAETEAQHQLGRHYRDLAVERLTTDRGISAVAAGKIVEAETFYWTYGFMDQTLNYRLEAPTCRFAEVRSGMS